MATYYINADSGSDSTGTGTALLPWKTLSKAITSSTTDDTVVFQESSAKYTVTTSFHLYQRTYTASAVGDAIISFNGAGVGLFFYTSTFNKLIFEIYSTNERPFMANSTSAITQFNDCIFRNCKCASSSGGLFTSSNSSSLLFDRCLFYNNLSTVTVSLFAGWYNTTVSLISLTNCVVHGGSLYYLFYMGNTVLTAYDMQNTIIYGTMTRLGIVSYGSATARTLSNNCLYTVADMPAHTGLITVDPLFVDVANLDFRLRPSSPCLGTGILL